MAFRALSSQNSDRQNWGQVNDMVRQLNNEQQVKAFKGPTGTNAVVIGKMPNGKYGILIYDGDRAVVLIGESPDNTFGLWVSKEGEDVLDAFS